jgi:hypothetical protein
LALQQSRDDSLLFVAAYFVGVAVTRASGDFFNDEMPYFVPTEDNIRTAAYCDLADTVARESGITELVKKTTGNTGHDCGKGRAAKRAIQQLFNIQEDSILLEGSDKTDRLNQLHSQILVLRGAAFNGLLTFLLLCAFGLSHSSGRRQLWWIIPMVTGGVVIAFLVYHTHGLTDPPFMELVWVVVGLAGGYVWWKGAPDARYAAGSLMSFLAFIVAFMGWWWSELIYDQQVFYSFYAQNQNLLNLAK